MGMTGIFLLHAEIVAAEIDRVKFVGSDAPCQHLFLPLFGVELPFIAGFEQEGLGRAIVLRR